MSSLRAFAKRILPLSDPRLITAIRRLRDVRTWPLAWDAGKRRHLLADFQRCQTFEDYFAFARDAMAGGALQNAEEIRGAIDYIRAERPRTMCEIGTANGGTNLLLSHMVESVGTIIGVDLFITNGAILRLLLRPGQQLHLINGSSQTRPTFEKVRRTLGGQSIDLLFIDGDHRYDGVKQDFLLYRELVRDGGLIMFHDIVPDHGSRYGQPTTHCAGDVPHFWNQLKPHFRHREFFRDPAQDGLGLGILHWSPSTPLPPLELPGAG